MVLDFDKLEREVKERGKVTELDNGAVIISENNPGLGLVQGRVQINAGSWHERPADLGVMHFIEHMLFNGSQGYSREERDRLSERLGLMVNAQTGLFSVIAPITGANETGYLLQGNFEPAARMVIDTVYRPLFDVCAIEKERRIVQREREERCFEHGSPSMIKAREEVKRILYGKNEFKPVIGTRETIDGLTAGALEDYHGYFFVGANTNVSLIGDVNGNSGVCRVVEEALESIPKGEKADRHEYASEEPLRGVRRISADGSGQKNAYIQISFQIQDPEEDYHNIRMLNAILGGEGNSILFQEVREKRGLVYGISSSAQGHDKTGYLQIEYRVDPRRIDESLAAVEGAIGRVRGGDFPEEMIVGEKARYLPKLIHTFQNPGWVERELAYRRIANEHGKPVKTGFENIQRVFDLDKRGVVAAANKYLNGKRVILVVNP